MRKQCQPAKAKGKGGRETRDERDDRERADDVLSYPYDHFSTWYLYNITILYIYTFNSFFPECAGLGLVLTSGWLSPWAMPIGSLA